jgi:3-deoxy-D-manno-octulosonic-acid transferase
MQILYSIVVEFLWWLTLPFLMFKARFRKVLFARILQKKSLKHSLDLKAHNTSTVWFHCASLGEFEQARPVIESYRALHPKHFIALTFFSDSGFDQRKNYEMVNWVGYLPFDRYFQTKKFIQTLSPDLVFFVKYEIWPNVFFELQKRKIALHLFSARFREEQRFFGAFSFFWLRVLQSVNQFYVQDQQSENALLKFDFNNVLLSGDTRFDRVLEISKTDHSEIHDKLKTWAEKSKVLVLGSSYVKEEQMTMQWLKNQKDWKIIVVPHEVSMNRIIEIQNTFQTFKTQVWSSNDFSSNNQVLIIDKIGLLSAIYAIADAAVIGGGFHKGIHNTLEAAVFNVPLCFGEKYQTFQEAIDLLACGAAWTFSDQDEFNACMEKMKPLHHASGGADYVQRNAGATLKILNKALSKI